MLLYQNLHEYKRVIETVDITEEGMFLKDGAPDDYGGAVLQVELVHMLWLCDAAGQMQIVKLDNPKPMKKDKTPSDNPIQMDGEEYKPGSGEPRIWTSKPGANLDPAIKTRADAVKQIMDSDGKTGTKL